MASGVKVVHISTKRQVGPILGDMIEPIQEQIKPKVSIKKPAVVVQSHRKSIVSRNDEESDGNNRPIDPRADTLLLLPKYERSIAELYNFISEHQDDIMFDPSLLKDFEDLSALAMESGQEGNRLLEILIQQGWTGNQYILGSIDIEVLCQALGTLYMSRVLPLRILAEEREEFNDPLFNQEESLIKSFCPSALLQTLSADILYELFSEMKCKSTKVYGACMLADISGFTKMSSRHCQEGAKGLDKLHKATNGFLGKLVSTVYSYGGDVISFAGDALICTFINEEQFFDEDQDAASQQFDKKVMKECCLRAMQCALELKEYYNDDLTCHIAVTCGKMSFGNLGGYRDEWVCLLNGPCISELSQAIDDAGSREVVVSAQVYNAVQGSIGTGEYIESETLPSKNIKIISIKTPSKFRQKQNRMAQIESSEELIESSRLFVPPPAHFAICSGSLDHINELREVTTMFFKLDSYSPQTHEDPTTLQSFFYMSQECLHASGGFMRQFLIDDKGCVLIGMWGVPSFSHANNTTRALNCAVSIMQNLKNLGHKGSIGITTGPIYCGNVGSPLRRDYVGIGDKVNLAARLMGKAKGLIFVDEASFKNLSTTAKSGINKSPDGLVLKGIADPIFPYIVSDFIPAVFVFDDKVDNNSMNLDPTISKTLEDQLDKVSVNTTAAAHSGKLTPADAKLKKTGRQATLKQINTKLENHASLTVLRGMPGMGKKTAALYFLRSAKNRYLRTVFIALRSGDEIKPFGLMRKLTLSLMDPQEFITDDEQRRTLDKLLSKVYENDAKKMQKALFAMKIVLDLQWTVDGEKSLDTSNLNNDKTLREVLLYILSKQATAIAIENAQYCDELSWNELLYIAEMPTRVGILITLSTLQTGSGAGAVSSFNHSPVKQSRKSMDGSLRQSADTESALGLRLLSPGFFANIASRPNCVVLDLPPLTKDDVQKILVKILEREVDDVIVKLVHDASSGNPFWCQLVANYIKDSGLDDFHEAYNNNKSRNPLNVVFVCRLEKLAPDHQVIARYASVLGDEFTLPRLLSVVPPKFKDNMERCLSILSEYGFILCIGQNPPSYAFQNLLIRQFLYELTPYSDQRKIHEAYARFLLETEKDNLRPFYSVLSYHFLNSSDCEDVAYKYTVKAADQAIYRGAFADGLKFVQQAVKLNTSSDNKNVLLRVIDRALKDLQPKDVPSNFTFGRKKVFSAADAMFKSTAAIEMEEYKKLKETIEKQLVESATGVEMKDKGDHSEKRPSVKASGPGGSDRPGRPNLQSAWEPSYTAGKTVKTPNNGIGAGCIVS